MTELAKVPLNMEIFQHIEVFLHPLAQMTPVETKTWVQITFLAWLWSTQEAKVTMP